MAFVINFSLIFIVVILGINLTGVWFVKGAVRASLDSGARYGALEGNSVAECESRARRSAADLLGTAGGGIRINCSDDGVTVRAEAEGEVSLWVAFGGPYDSFDIGHTAVIIREPEIDG